ncbi:MAG: S1 RNA-binding domain-containing protein, partial [Williamsia herbipolensis]|nr:S1 RNA-binding domain-containing protein [Williamsia herbipolensis]
GLVHVSAMSDRFVSDPHEVVRSGQVVRVKVLEVDVDRQRIGLTLRLNDEAKPGSGPRGQKSRSSTSPGPRDGNRPGRQGGPRRADRPRREAAPASGSMAQALRDAGFGR